MACLGHNDVMAKLNTDIPDDLRAPLLQAALVHVPFEGWGDKALALAAQDLKIEAGLADLAFPGGAGDMIDMLAQQQDQNMVDACPDEALKNLKIRQKITRLVKSRIEAEQNIREAARRAVTYLALPQNAALGLKILYRSVDLMWKTIHDPSTDFNFYTKRLTLSGVYSSTFLYWLNDESEDFTETWAFLDRRITNVMQFEKTKAQFKSGCKATTDRLPDIWQNISNLRYPSNS
ncbi:MAG: COQ9 family protein [Alphaproteobacteria bacterium]|nr:MAG: COQ9 family protein [Alphaproteobacteria bacterium]